MGVVGVAIRMNVRRYVMRRLNRFWCFIGLHQYRYRSSVDRTCWRCGQNEFYTFIDGGTYWVRTGE